MTTSRSQASAQKADGQGARRDCSEVTLAVNCHLVLAPWAGEEASFGPPARLTQSGVRNVLVIPTMTGTARSIADRRPEHPGQCRASALVVDTVGSRLGVDADLCARQRPVVPALGDDIAAVAAIRAVGAPAAVRPG